ncbi:MAG: hypothetical protein ACPHCV_08105, partial [Pseudohongiellaceae bacterium]
TDFRQQQPDECGLLGERPDHDARVEIFKRKIADQLSKMRGATPRSPANLHGIQTQCIRTAES